jgi:putative endonuclease
MHVVYLIQNDVTKEKYFGVTNNLRKRITDHNSKSKKFTTRKQGKWMLIYAEVYRSKPDAMLREKRLKKHASGKHELLKRLINSLLV